MTFHDCLCDAVAAVDADVPPWLLPTTILNHASLLAGGRRDSEELAAWH